MTQTESEELESFRKVVEKLAADVFRPRAAIWDREARPPYDNLPVLAQAGIAAITAPEEYGGSGGTISHALTAVEEIARACPVTAVVVLGNCVTTEMLMRFGTEEQRESWLPPIAAGEFVSAWAMTEAEAGSAATDLTTKAVPVAGGYEITGRKNFISRGGMAKLFIVWARVGDVQGGRGIAGFLVDRDSPGFSIGSSDAGMGFRGAASAELVFDGVKVSDKDMIVPPGSFGDAMKGLNVARVLNPGVSVGIATEALHLAVEYAKTRRQFGSDLASFQGVQWMLADMAILVDVMTTMARRSAKSAEDNHPDASLHAAVGKAFINDNAFDVVDNAMQIHGAYGYSSEFPLERMLRDVRAFQIAGGTTQMLRNTIAASTLGRRINQRQGSPS